LKGQSVSIPRTYLKDRIDPLTLQIGARAQGTGLQDGIGHLWDDKGIETAPDMTRVSGKGTEIRAFRGFKLTENDKIAGMKLII